MVDTERVIAPTLRAVANPLVIVESPAKAKTIAGYLGSGYDVDSSVGHIRDLPQNAADVPAAYKGEPGPASAWTPTTTSSPCTW